MFLLTKRWHMKERTSQRRKKFFFWCNTNRDKISLPLIQTTFFVKINILYTHVLFNYNKITLHNFCGAQYSHFIHLTIELCSSRIFFTERKITIDEHYTVMDGVYVKRYCIYSSFFYFLLFLRRRRKRWKNSITQHKINKTIS